ncbi:MAG: hypothetical protein Q6J68_06610 [Thermostichales cyanobacterium SZTDM-1c_bins_54]
MTDPELQNRLRSLELEINATAVPPQKATQDPPKPLSSASPLKGWQWLVGGIGVVVALGFLLRLLDLAIKLAVVAAIGYVIYRWLIRPKLRRR